MDDEIDDWKLSDEQVARRQRQTDAMRSEMAAALAPLRAAEVFAATGSSDIAAPRIFVRRQLVNYPIDAAQASALASGADRASFGVGAMTRVDADVRDSWQIDPVFIEFAQSDSKRWAEAVQAMAGELARQLGVDGAVDATLYKALVYAPNGHFTRHRDTEKVDGMFATMVVVLPSTYAGGEIAISLENDQITLALQPTASHVAYGAFYCDCVHEVRPVTDGWRVALIYNIARVYSAPAAGTFDHSAATALGESLSRWRARPDHPARLMYVLRHHYSASQIRFGRLRGADITIANSVAEAARRAGCDAHLALLTIFDHYPATPNFTQEESAAIKWSGRQLGPLEFNASNPGIDPEDRHRSMWLSHWWRTGDVRIPYGRWSADDEEPVPATALDDELPDVKRYSEIAGNDPVSYTERYRRAVIVVWPRDGLARAVTTWDASLFIAILEHAIFAGEADRVTRGRPQPERIRRLVGAVLREWNKMSGNASAQLDPQLATRFLKALASIRYSLGIDEFLERIVAGRIIHPEVARAIVRAVNRLPGVSRVGLLKSVARRSTRIGGERAILFVDAWRGRGRDESPLYREARAALLRYMLSRSEQSPVVVTDNAPLLTTPNLTVEHLRALLSILSRCDDPTLGEPFANLFGRRQDDRRLIADLATAVLHERHRFEWTPKQRRKLEPIETFVRQWLANDVRVSRQPFETPEHNFPLPAKLPRKARLRRFFADPRATEVELRVSEAELVQLLVALGEYRDHLWWSAGQAATRMVLRVGRRHVVAQSDGALSARIEGLYAQFAQEPPL